jgi:hypothetical protein
MTVGSEIPRLRRGVSLPGYVAEAAKKLAITARNALD